MKARLRFSKLGKVRWTSHRDVARMWERALRRAGLPVARTGGFTPRPQMSFGLALPTGCESIAEYLDLGFEYPVRVDELPGVLSPLLPEGVDVLVAAELAGDMGSLQQEVTSCTWEIQVPGVCPSDLRAVLEGVLATAELPVRRERKGREVEDDLRPSLISLNSEESVEEGSLLVAETATNPRGVRPSELAKALGLSVGRACRTSQWIEHGAIRREPLALPVAVVMGEPVSGRAS